MTRILYPGYPQLPEGWFDWTREHNLELTGNGWFIHRDSKRQFLVTEYNCSFQIRVASKTRWWKICIGHSVPLPLTKEDFDFAMVELYLVSSDGKTIDERKAEQNV